MGRGISLRWTEAWHFFLNRLHTETLGMSPMYFQKKNGDEVEPMIRSDLLTLEFGINITFGELEADIESTSRTERI